MARFLLTGGAGFLGINLARHLLALDHEVVSLDIADFDYPERERIREVTGDIRDRGVVDSAMDRLRHCRACRRRLAPLFARRDLQHRC